MKGSDIVALIGKKAGLTQEEAKIATKVIFKRMSRALAKNNRIEIRGFGSFYRKERKAFVGFNPKTGEKINIPKRYSIAFRPSRKLKELLNK